VRLPPDFRNTLDCPPAAGRGVGASSEAKVLPCHFAGAQFGIVAAITALYDDRRTAIEALPHVRGGAELDRHEQTGLMRSKRGRGFHRAQVYKPSPMGAYGVGSGLLAAEKGYPLG
jgi:hypothetical protein